MQCGLKQNATLTSTTLNWHNWDRECLLPTSKSCELLCGVWSQEYRWKGQSLISPITDNISYHAKSYGLEAKLLRHRVGLCHCILGFSIKPPNFKPSPTYIEWGWKMYTIADTNQLRFALKQINTILSISIRSRQQGLHCLPRSRQKGI